MAERIYSPPAIISYAFVHEPSEGLDGQMEYSCRLVWDKKKQAKELKTLIEKTREVGRAEHGPNKFKLPFRDGDAELESGDQTDEELYTGRVFINSKSRRKPGIVDKDGHPLENPEEQLYSGCIVRVSLRPYAWKNDKGGRGVSLGLGNIQKLADGPRLDGSISAEKDFADVPPAPTELPFETVEVDPMAGETEADDASWDEDDDLGL